MGKSGTVNGQSWLKYVNAGRYRVQLNWENAGKMAGRTGRRANLEGAFKPLEGGRIGIPDRVATAIKWMAGDEPIEVFLLMLRPGRYRVVTMSEVDETERLASLRDRIAAGAERTNRNAFDFERNAVATVAARLISTRISPSGAEWRLSVPALAAGILGLGQRNRQAAVIPVGQYVEVWSRQTYLLSFDEPLDELFPEL